MERMLAKNISAIGIATFLPKPTNPGVGAQKKVAPKTVELRMTPPPGPQLKRVAQGTAEPLPKKLKGDNPCVLKLADASGKGIPSDFSAFCDVKLICSVMRVSILPADYDSRMSEKRGCHFSATSSTALRLPR